MVRINLVLFFIVSASHLVQAQVNRYMVFFTDKIGTPYSVDTPEDFLSDRAIQRRTNQSITVLNEDLPLTPAYVDGVRNEGVTVLFKTKWMNGVLVECTTSQVATLEGLSYVSSVEYVAPGGRPSAGGKISSGKFSKVKETSAATDVQLEMLGLDAMHEAGYKGEGMLIAIMDAGFPGTNVTQPFQHIFNEGRLDAATSYNFVSGIPNVFTGNSHGTHVWSIMGAYANGTYTGGAYKANFMLFITEDVASEYRVEEYNWLFAAERADSAGADVINTSLGYYDFDDDLMNYSKAQMDGLTAVITRAANEAASRGIAVVVSAGNEGANSWGIVAAPADSENVLSIGSVDASGVKVNSSSTGPTADGRIKPDVAALGSSVSLINTSGNVSAGGGTSYASPLAASLVAGVWQMLPDLTVKELFDTIRHRASQAQNPDNLLGYGIANFVNVITSTDDEIAQTVQVFPNPTKGKFFLRVENGIQQIHIKVIDSKGGTVGAELSQINDHEFSIDLSHQKPGLYLLRIHHGKFVSTHKVLKGE